MTEQKQIKLKPYPKYKPSGVQWLGDVPEHWTVTQLNKFVDIQNGLDYKQIEDTEGYPVLGSGGIFAYASNFLYDGESILLGRKGTIDKPLHVNGRFWTVDTMYWTKIHPNVCGRFVYYSALMIPFNYYSTSTAIPSMTKGDLDSHLVAYPPLDEQRAIAEFLDRETAKIDRLVEKQKTLIERLKEKRTALISHVVTKGLDPKVKMKPSGIPWLGDIPEHWEVNKFSREVAIAEGQVNPENEPYASMLLIGPEHVESKTGRLIQQTTAADQAAESGKYYCHKGDVVYSKIRPALRKAVIAPEDCLCSADMYPLFGKRRISNDYIYWVFLSEQFSAWSVLEAERVAMPKINRDTLNELRMPIPPLSEQQAIAAHLDRETGKIYALVSKVEQAIERLQEYRTALISEAVTGKIDVTRNVKAG